MRGQVLSGAVWLSVVLYGDVWFGKVQFGKVWDNLWWGCGAVRPCLVR